MSLPKGTPDRITAWLRDYAAQAGAAGYVVGLSGGIDSACTAVLCKRAVAENVLAVLLPCYSSAEDSDMALLLADTFGIRSTTVDLAATYQAILASLPAGLLPLASANVKPRLRMAALYALAQTHGYLVAGTGNRSEIAVGYFTKYGDGGVDVEPLGDLYKSQIRLLARELAIPQPIIDRPPSAGLWFGQTDEGEMGLTYDELDRILAAIEGEETEQVEPASLDKVRRMLASSDHKRSMPPICPIPQNGTRRRTYPV
jgi:NAD+ synthase